MTDPADQRRWWLVAASNIGRSHLYEARNQRSAIAAFRRDLSEAERANGRPRRETELWLRANDFVARGPLTTEQAFDIDFRWALSTAIDRWSPIQHDPDSSATAEDARRYGISDERIERIRQQVGAKYAHQTASNRTENHMTITVYGYSDDLIEIEGDIREEFPIKDDSADGGDLLAFSDGTILRITFGESGIWRITPIANGSAELTVKQVTEDDDEHSDRATLTGDVRWVVHGIGHAARKDG